MPSRTFTIVFNDKRLPPREAMEAAIELYCPKCDADLKIVQSDGEPIDWFLGVEHDDDCPVLAEMG